jgi:hypothetical protein
MLKGDSASDDVEETTDRIVDPGEESF